MLNCGHVQDSYVSGSCLSSTAIFTSLKHNVKELSDDNFSTDYNGRRSQKEKELNTAACVVCVVVSSCIVLSGVTFPTIVENDLSLCVTKKNWMMAKQKKPTIFNVHTVQ